MLSFFKYFLSFLVLNSLFSIFSFAQEKQNNNYKWGISLQLYSPEKLNPVAGFTNDYWFGGSDVKENTFFSYGIKGNYHLTNSVSLAFRGGMNPRKITESYNGYIGATGVNKGSATIKQTAFHFAIGIEKGFRTEKFNAYVGLESPFTLYKELTVRYTQAFSAVTINGYADVPGGYEIGLGSYVGGSYMFCKNFSVGPSFAASLSYLNIGGMVNSGYTSDNQMLFPDTQTMASNTIKKIGVVDIKAFLNFSFSF